MKRTPLKRMGKDKARETAKYWPLRRKFLEENPCCEFSEWLSPVASCTKSATQIHHMKGQNWRVMNDTRYWMGLCADHHRWITDHQTEARKRGMILIK